MFLQIAMGSALMIITTFIHAGCTLAAFWALAQTHPDRWKFRSRWSRVGLAAALIWMLFIAALLEIYIWAGAYIVSGALSALEPAVYFSMVTYTTLGYGDITLNPNWRLLASFQAANGMLLFGWSTALIFAFIHRLATQDEALAARLESTG